MMATAREGRAQAVRATYAYTAPGSSRTLTFAQSSQKSRVDFGNGTYAIYTGTTFYECTHAKCKVLRGTASPRAQLANVYNGQTFLTTMQDVVLRASQRSAYGLTVRFSRATYAGRPSRCVTLVITKQKPGTVTLCETASGIMDHEAAGTSSATLVSLTGTPPASDFVVPRHSARTR